MVRESTPSQSCQLVAQHEALTDKLTILFFKKRCTILTDGTPSTNKKIKHEYLIYYQNNAFNRILEMFKLLDKSHKRNPRGSIRNV